MRTACASCHQGGEATAQAVSPCAAIIAAGLWVLSAPRAQENWAVPTEGSTREITWGMLTLSDLVRIYLVAGYPENIPSKALFYFYLCVSQGICAHEHQYLWRPEESIRPPGAGVTGRRELPDVGTGTLTQFRMCS